MTLQANSFWPSWVSPPGDTIGDILNERKMSIRDFAVLADLDITEATNLLSGKTVITSSIEKKLSSVLGSTPSFWNAREKNFREDIKRLFENQESEGWWNTIPWADMRKFGWLPALSKTSFKLVEGLRFFDVSSIDAWTARYSTPTNMAAFRKSNSFSSETGATAAWLRHGEIEAQRICCGPWNKNKFEQSLSFIRPLTIEKDPKIFLPKLKKICAENGVAVVITRSPSGCRASGATRFFGTNKAILQLSFRFLSDDQFWFTFFHEAAHLILHSSEKIFLEEKEMASTVEEAEADEYSSNFLIPHTFRAQLTSIKNNPRKILRLAQDLGISAGIIIGQMQYMNLIPYNYFSKMKIRYKWSDIHHAND